MDGIAHQRVRDIALRIEELRTDVEEINLRLARQRSQAFVEANGRNGPRNSDSELS
jgi:hypothetical protein